MGETMRTPHCKDQRCTSWLSPLAASAAAALCLIFIPSGWSGTTARAQGSAGDALGPVIVQPVTLSVDPTVSMATEPSPATLCDPVKEPDVLCRPGTVPLP